jgi:mycothiol synthase
MSSSPPEFAVRPAGPEDVERAYDVVAALDTSLGVDTGLEVEDLREMWRTHESAWLWDREGDTVGYGSLRLRGSRFEGNGFVHPSFFGRGLGTAILETLEARARELDTPKLGSGILGGDERAVRLLEAHGYRELRHFYRMTIDMDEPPPAPEWPDGLEPRSLELEHALAFHAADDEAFEDEWEHIPEPFEEFTQRRLESPRFDPSLWTAVWDSDQIAATLIADWKHFGAGWIAGLGVRRPWRRRGVAHALLLRAFGQFYDRGERRVSLAVDSESPTGATRLYERVGMRVKWEVVAYEKDLDGG